MSEEEPFPPAPSEDELPPPPSDIAEDANKYKPVIVKKTKPLATIRRAFIIFEKDLRTMAKHGLVSAVILFIFLSVIFTIMSFSMKESMKFSLGGEGGGKEGFPGATGVDPPLAVISGVPDGSITAGLTVTLDASSSTDNNQIVFYVWNVGGEGGDTEMFGKTVQYTFYIVGSYEVRLTVVDNEWNFNETMTTVNTGPSTSDTTPPMANTGPTIFINVGESAFFDGSASTDNVGIVNWTWTFEDGIDRAAYGENVSYRFDNAGYYDIKLTVRDASGNRNSNGLSVNVASNPPGDNQAPNARGSVPSSAHVGDIVNLDASDSNDNQMISSYTWYIKFNGTLKSTITGETTSFEVTSVGLYAVTLVVRDGSGNAASWMAEPGIIVTPAGMSLSGVSWTSTPFDIDVSFNLLTFVYGITLLASVIYIGGLFAKGFTHEITKGTVKVLFFAPISVTTMIFSKILYPLIIGPIFIFPLVVIGLSPFELQLGDILVIILVSYAMAALTMVSAAYGSCLIYIAAKKMVLKPSVLSRMFLYFSLIGTLTVFEWLSFVLDMWQNTEKWGNMYDQYSGIAIFSPFHQGGVLLSNMFIGTSWPMDLWVFIIPALLIVGGALASRKLYGDIFARE